MSPVRSASHPYGSAAAPGESLGISWPPAMDVTRGAKHPAIIVSGALARELSKPVDLSHVRRLCDDTGILEHAEGAIPRREHGYCTDDVSRQLLVACLYPNDPRAERIAEQGLAFVRHAALPEGRFRSRMNYARIWMDEGNSDDASGRAIWSLGVAVQRAPWPHVRDAALSLFETTISFVSPHWHSNAFAALGASAVLTASPQNRSARAFAERLAVELPQVRKQTRSVDEAPTQEDLWLWPEARMTYSSAALPDALLALCDVQPRLLDEGLTLLQSLVDRMIRNGFSPVPVDGLGPNDLRPGFDQQPIEAQAFAGACWRAWTLTGDPRWLEHVVLAAAWFVGANDAHTYMIDRRTNGCFDGLMSYGRNVNQGAESTLAMLHTMAILRRGVDEGAIILRHLEGKNADDPRTSGISDGPPGSSRLAVQMEIV